jgi:hypothetical protein
MSATIGVTQDLAEQVAEFVKAETLALEVVSAGSGTVQIVQTEDKEQSDPSTLRAGGWITCTDVFALASKLGLPTRTMGKFLNVLDIKIRECQLGCF